MNAYTDQCLKVLKVRKVYKVKNILGEHCSPFFWIVLLYFLLNRLMIKQIFYKIPQFRPLSPSPLSIGEKTLCLM